VADAIGEIQGVPSKAGTFIDALDAFGTRLTVGTFWFAGVEIAAEGGLWAIAVLKTAIFAAIGRWIANSNPIFRQTCLPIWTGARPAFRVLGGVTHVAGIIAIGVSVFCT
jgi:hypothetical protein